MQFKAARLKVERANKHILELNSVLQGFTNTDFYDLSTKKDPNTGHDVLQFRILKSIPEVMAPIIGDAIHNLRSALDLMISEIVNRAGGSADHAKFPFGTNECREQFIARFDGGVVKPCLPEPLCREIFDVIQPYKGGNEPICALHDLDILDKHILLIPMLHVATLEGVHIEDDTRQMVIMGTMRVESSSSGGPVGWDTGLAKREKIYIYNKGTPSADILFRDGGPLQRQAIIPTLKQLSQIVLGIIERFETVYFGK